MQRHSSVGISQKVVLDNNCVYCGNNPLASHFFTWYFESLNVLMTPLRQALLYNRGAIFFKRRLARLNLSQGLATILLDLKVLSLQKDIAKCKVRRARVLWEEAGRRNIEMDELLLFGRPFDTYLAQKSEIRNSKSETNSKFQIPKIKTIVFSGLPRPKNYDAAALDVMDDKIILKNKFKAADLPVPRGGSCSAFRRAREIFRGIQKPAIVKPRAGSRGRHTTTFVHSEQDLKKAFKIAKQLCYWVVVEEQLLGPVYRGTVIDYKIRGVLRGDPPQAMGDGEHTVQELIKIKNQMPHPGVKDIIAGDETKIFLSRQSLSLESIPKPNQIVNLSEKIGVNYGGSSSEDFEICHPDNKELFEQAARAAGDPIAGFDFIIPDITQSYKNQRCGFIEANSLPFINLHHDPLRGKPINIAKYVWDLAGM